ncbi:WXG100 family type VII secretion target [Streptomyces sp.]|jgi:WXG100 family type VII secretion target|uniref:WXG100 family type VII secretion target n=1 Tax=Streptomyces sp. TaxID=1931 RepID=UPI002D7738A8|nr:WXG100 family type VII secretion target [Streptomyces sp.]HET6357046.1 WXG100 family type VII secretion target [Streptomyces sp.]
MTTAVNYDTVTTAASDVRGTSKYLNEQLRDLLSHVKTVAGNWDGEAKTAYIEIQSNLARDMDGLNADLAHIARLLDESVIGYQDTDKGNAARFRMMH